MSTNRHNQEPGLAPGLDIVANAKAVLEPAEMPAHPLADIFPLMKGPSFDELVADIKAIGVLQPVTLLDGQVLDGRNRARAAKVAGVFCPTCSYPGKKDPDSLRAFVFAANLHRRHLGESQRAMVAARIATLGLGTNQHAQLCAPTQDDAAEMLGVSRRIVQHAKLVLRSSVPKLIDACDDGRISVSLAKRAVDMSDDDLQKFIARVDGGAKPIRALQQVQHEALATSALPDGKYRVILADPPWKYDPRPEALAATDPEDHYPTMSEQEIAALSVADRAAEDCVLFCWATFPLLPTALRVVHAWGFTYKTAFVWNKQRYNMGHYHRCEAELLLVCTRGSFAPVVDDRPSQIIEGGAAEHSRKPEESYGLIDGLYPHGPRLELFARRVRDGWDSWGNELATSASIDSPSVQHVADECDEEAA